MTQAWETTLVNKSVIHQSVESGALGKKVASYALYVKRGNGFSAKVILNFVD